MADQKGATIIIKRIKKGGHGHHGGAWKVAYADFVTAMMCFFLVMWLMGSDEETKAAIAHYFNHPNTPWQSGQDPKSSSVHPMGERDGAGDSLMSGMEGLFPEDLIVDRPLRELKDLLKENRAMSHMIEDVLMGNVYAVDVTANTVKFSLPDYILFPSDSSELTYEAKQYLDRLGPVLKSYDGNVIIDGHTDDTPIKQGGRYSNNWELSLGRAVSVMDYLVGKFKLDQNKFFPAGSGPRKILVPNTDSESRKKNRRVEFTLSHSRKL